MAPAVLDEHAVGKLRWRCRRGLLENDLLLERFFGRHGSSLAPAQGLVLEELMQLPDNDLTDLLLRRTEPSGEFDREDVRALLGLLRSS